MPRNAVKLRSSPITRVATRRRSNGVRKHPQLWMIPLSPRTKGSRLAPPRQQQRARARGIHASNNFGVRRHQQETSHADSSMPSRSSTKRLKAVALLTAPPCTQNTLCITLRMTSLYTSRAELHPNRALQHGCFCVARETDMHAGGTPKKKSTKVQTTKSKRMVCADK